MGASLLVIFGIRQGNACCLTCATVEDAVCGALMLLFSLMPFLIRRIAIAGVLTVLPGIAMIGGSVLGCILCCRVQAATASVQQASGYAATEVTVVGQPVSLENNTVAAAK